MDRSSRSASSGPSSSASAHASSSVFSSGPLAPPRLEERTVIHDGLLRNAIHKELQHQYDANTVPSESDIDLSAATTLVLSFRSIYAIDHLAGFSQLTTLKLDNNHIERIENLSHLTQLTWLDLSFNRITTIEGLDGLVNLEDLTLFDNQITSIGTGLQQLTKLNVLSIGNNQLADLTQIQELRQFRNLRLLNLRGNPVCSLDDYHTTVFAYLTSLQYLDYAVIDREQFARARDAKLDQLLLLEHKEKGAAEEAAQRTQQQAQQALLNAAHLEGVSTLFSDMLRADPEHVKLCLLPGFESKLDSFRAHFDSLVNAFTVDVMCKARLKEEEKEMYTSVAKECNEEAERGSRDGIQAYEKGKKKMMRMYNEAVERERDGTSQRGSTTTPSSTPKSILLSLQSSLTSCLDSLMDIEMLAKERHHALLDELDKSYTKLVADTLTRIALCFRALLDASSQHQSALYDLSHHLMEQYAKEEIHGMTSEVRALLGDKEALNAAVSNGHDYQDARILAMEELVREREETACKEWLGGVREREKKRNRKRVAEIGSWGARESAEIEELLEQEQAEEDAGGE